MTLLWEHDHSWSPSGNFPEPMEAALLKVMLPSLGQRPHPVPGWCGNTWLPFLFKARQLYRNIPTSELPVWSTEASVATASQFNSSPCPVLTLSLSYSCCTQVQSPVCLLYTSLHLRLGSAGNKHTVKYLDSMKSLRHARVFFSKEE